MLKIIDTHQHLWDLKRLDLPWLAKLPSLNRSFWIDQYIEATAGQPIQKSVYMEVDSAPKHRDLEIELITALCENAAYPTSGMVIALDPNSADFESILDKHRGNYYIQGIRQVLHTPAQAQGYCLQNGFIKNLQKLANRDLLFDICIRPSELSDAVKLAKLCPETRFVIDHCGNANANVVNGEITFNGPPAQRSTERSMEHGMNQWRDEMAELGALTNTVCKISGLVTGLSIKDAALSIREAAALSSTLAATVNYCLDVFAEDRVIFGGDWPVCTLGTSLDIWITALRDIVAERPLALQQKLFSENAEEIYSL